MRLKIYTNWLFCLLLSGLISSFLYYYPLFLNQKKSEVDQIEKIIENQSEDMLQDLQDDQIVLNVPDGYSFENLMQGSAVQDIPQSQELEIFPVEEIKVTQHLFKKMSKDVFRTVEERQEFFKELGIDYLNETIFEYLPALDADAKNCEQYLNDIDENDFLTQTYADDIAAHRLIETSIRWLGQEIGHGVFAEEDVFSGGFIGIYGGVVQDRSLVKDRDYAWAYPGKTLEEGRLTLDAAQKGNELRLVNDGKHPNCIMKSILGNDGFWHICYIAIQDIAKGDQLLISYGPSYWDTRKYKYQELTIIK